jgi:hypothetical protein
MKKCLAEISQRSNREVASQLRGRTKERFQEKQDNIGCLLAQAKQDNAPSGSLALVKHQLSKVAVKREQDAALFTSHSE